MSLIFEAEHDKRDVSSEKSRELLNKLSDMLFT